MSAPWSISARRRLRERAKAEAKAAAAAAARAARAAMENARRPSRPPPPSTRRRPTSSSPPRPRLPQRLTRQPRRSRRLKPRLAAAKAKLARLQVVNKAETASKLRARNALTNQTLALGAEAKAKMAADSIAEAQSATEMAAASEISAVAERRRPRGCRLGDQK